MEQWRMYSRTPKKIVLVGSNPSVKAASQVAFSPCTKSGRLVEEWLLPFDKLIATRCYINVYDKPTENNRPLTAKEIKAGCNNLQNAITLFKPDLIIAFGKTASRALTLLGYEHYEMPHPSGLNRQLNDPTYVQEKLKGLEALLQPTPSSTGVRN
jgi:uracil-DNA glycosylase family 4